MIKAIFRHLNILNLILIGILVILARYALYPSPEPKIKITSTSEQRGIIEDNSKEKETSSFPSDYMVIAEQNPFHPERKIPVEKKAEQPLPKPEFVLYGTLITDDLSIAYMEDKKSPVSTPGRGNRQTPLKVGQSLSGFTLKEIEAEKVVMVRGEEKMTVYLNDPNEPKKRETTAPVAAKTPGTPQTGSKPARQSPEQREAAATTQPKTTPIVPPTDQRTKPKEPLSPEQANKARDAFLKFFQRR